MFFKSLGGPSLPGNWSASAKQWSLLADKPTQQAGITFLPNAECLTYSADSLLQVLHHQIPPTLQKPKDEKQNLISPQKAIMTKNPRLQRNQQKWKM